MAGFPVVIADSGLPVRQVESGAPTMTVATNGFGVPIMLSENGAPFIVEGAGPRITMTITPPAENAATGTAIGTPSVINGTAAGPITISADPDNKFDMVDGDLVTDATLDYETATSHPVTLTDGVLSRTFTIPVTNVLEVTLAALTLSATEFVTGTPSSGTIIGAQTGETITPSGLPSGLTIDGPARTWAWDGTGTVSAGSLTLTGTHPDGINSPRDSVIGWEVVEVPALKIALMLAYGDSRIGGVYEGDRATLDAPVADMLQGVTDFDETGVPDAGYGTSHGITEVGLTSQLPFQMYQNTMGTDSHLSPFEGAAKYLLANGYDKVIVLGSGWGGSHFIVNGAALTVYAKLKAAWGLALAQAEYPGDVIEPIIALEYGVNDMTSASDSAVLASGLYAATLDWAADIRTVSGWAAAPIVGVAVTPEQMGILSANGIGDTAMRVALLKEVENVFWVQYPTGIGQLHEGDLTGTTEERRAMVRDAGFGHIGPMMSVALGNEAAPTPVYTIIDNLEVVEGSDQAINLGFNQPVYWHTVTSAGNIVEISGDLELPTQIARPAGGAWPAHDAGTPANNTRAYTLYGTTGFGVEVSVTRHVVITEAVTEVWALYDDFNRSTAADTYEAMGVSSGKDGTGGGVEWIAENGGCFIYNNACHASDGSFQGRASFADHGLGSYIDFSGTFTKGGSRPAFIYVGAEETELGSGVIDTWVRIQDSGHIYQLEGGSFAAAGTFTPPSDGTHSFRVTLEADQTLTLWIDGVVVTTKVMGVDSNWEVPAGRSFVGIGVEYNSTVVTFDNVGVKALPA